MGGMDRKQLAGGQGERVRESGVELMRHTVVVMAESSAKEFKMYPFLHSYQKRG